MARFALHPGERTIKHGWAGYLGGRVRTYPGDLILTDRRLVHTNKVQQIAGAAAPAGIVGVLVGHALSGKVDFEASLDTITHVARGKHGRNRQILTVADGSGEEHRFMAKPEEWFPAFGHALSLWRRQLVAAGPDSWAVSC
jgi:hypothetical protein